MRQNITPNPGRDWMDQKHAFQPSPRPSDTNAQIAATERLGTLRLDSLNRRVAQLWAVGRVPRVCLYTLAIGGKGATHSLDEARQFALRKGWQAATTQTVTDYHRATTPRSRPGWSSVCQQIRSGFADGVVAITHTAISSDLLEYEYQLQYFDRHLGFIALVTPETITGNP